MNNHDIAEALQDAYEEGFISGLGCTERLHVYIKNNMLKQYDLSNTRTLVNELWEGDITDVC